MSSQVRLEALKLAVTGGGATDVVITTAAAYEDYITNGKKVVEISIPTPAEPAVEIDLVEAAPPHLSRKQRRARK